ncbi:hypothetical protein L210DRAFT_3582968 [Boletus edulis BED1]|uniref:Uncharacterized protein n=1 Tax=Boletus edulis BED1 TaxID=1328754 RepID=A0AAD4G622_BOLED|nr:hypothetical protein L210DRAFT_3582968 [Boletus edulis BED1]
MTPSYVSVALFVRLGTSVVRLRPPVRVKRGLILRPWYIDDTLKRLYVRALKSYHCTRLRGSGIHRLYLIRGAHLARS